MPTPRAGRTVSPPCLCLCPAALTEPPSRRKPNPHGLAMALACRLPLERWPAGLLKRARCVGEAETGGTDGGTAIDNHAVRPIASSPPLALDAQMGQPCVPYPRLRSGCSGGEAGAVWVRVPAVPFQLSHLHSRTRIGCRSDEAFRAPSIRRGPPSAPSAHHTTSADRPRPAVSAPLPSTLSRLNRPSPLSGPPAS